MHVYNHVELPERKAEVAFEGGPGRTTMVGRRRMRPSMNPRRVYSFMNSSEASLPNPYEPSGVAIVEALMISGYIIA